MNLTFEPAHGRPMLLDGGTGSELRRRGVTLSPASWSATANFEATDVLLQIHCDYVAAGADIVTANTFAGTRFVLEADGLSHRLEAINRAAVAAAREAATGAGREILVAASLSCLPPRFDTGNYPPEEVEFAAYCELADSFVANGVDLILVEMLQDAEHAALACRAAAATGLPFVAGISCRRDPAAADCGRLVGFDQPDAPIHPVLAAVASFEPTCIAIMHTPLDAMMPALGWLHREWQGAIGAYAELPYPEDPIAKATARSDITSYAEAARQWLAAGASMIGGCCGTGPDHIRALRKLIQS